MVTAEAKALIRRLNNQVQNRTEMETMARVLILVLEVVNRIPRVKVKMQPSVEGHTGFHRLLFTCWNWWQSATPHRSGKKCCDRYRNFWNRCYSTTSSGGAHFTDWSSASNRYGLYSNEFKDVGNWESHQRGKQNKTYIKLYPYSSITYYVSRGRLCGGRITRSYWESDHERFVYCIYPHWLIAEHLVKISLYLFEISLLTHSSIQFHIIASHLFFQDSLLSHTFHHFINLKSHCSHILRLGRETTLWKHCQNSRH